MWHHRILLLYCSGYYLYFVIPTLVPGYEDTLCTCSFVKHLFVSLLCQTKLSLLNIYTWANKIYHTDLTNFQCIYEVFFLDKVNSHSFIIALSHFFNKTPRNLLFTKLSLDGYGTRLQVWKIQWELDSLLNSNDQFG